MSLCAGDQKHLVLAHLFEKPCFLGLLAVQVILHFISLYGTMAVFSFSNDFHNSLKIRTKE